MLAAIRRTAHQLTIRPADEGTLDYTLTCPLPLADTTRPCMLLLECGCRNDVDDLPCPQGSGVHRQSAQGFIGSVEPGCWLIATDQSYDAISELDLVPGCYLLDWSIDRDGFPVFEVLATLGGEALGGVR